MGLSASDHQFYLPSMPYGRHQILVVDATTCVFQQVTAGAAHADVMSYQNVSARAIEGDHDGWPRERSGVACSSCTATSAGRRSPRQQELRGAGRCVPTSASCTRRSRRVHRRSYRVTSTRTVCRLPDAGLSATTAPAAPVVEDSVTRLTRRAAQKARGRDHPELVPHGTVTGYQNWGCRCPLCRGQHSAAQARWRAARVARGEADPSLIPHGTTGGYINWGCRCNRCSAAQAIDHVDWYIGTHPAAFREERSR